jgi:hypothetical protein
MLVGPEECRRLAAHCKRLAKTAPTSIAAARFEELALLGFASPTTLRRPRLLWSTSVEPRRRPLKRGLRQQL